MVSFLPGEGKERRDRAAGAGKVESAMITDAEILGGIASMMTERDEAKRRCRELVVEKENLRDYVRILERIEKLYKCEHVKNGADDAENIARHVDETLEERDEMITRMRSIYYRPASGLFTHKENCNVRNPGEDGAGASCECGFDNLAKWMPTR